MISTELFVSDLERSVRFYVDVLDFRVTGRKEEAAWVEKEGGSLLLSSQTLLSPDHYFSPQDLAGRRGVGTEIMVTVSAVDTLYERVRERDWPLLVPLGERPWGMTDFRVADPDGYYLRITSPRREEGPPRLAGLHAVVLIARDLERQKRFYRDVLEMEVEGDYGDAVFLRCGGQKVALFSRDHHRQGTERLEGAAKGISHLEFLIPRADAAYWDRKLRRAGAHAYRGNYEDADGNLFHFVYGEEG